MAGLKTPIGSTLVVCMKYFDHKLPIHPTSMTKWRNRIGEAGAEEMLKQTIEAGLKLKAIKTTQLKRVNVDTTVMEKDIRFPTDARLYDLAQDSGERGKIQSPCITPGVETKPVLWTTLLNK